MWERSSNASLVTGCEVREVCLLDLQHDQRECVHAVVRWKYVSDSATASETEEAEYWVRKLGVLGLGWAKLELLM